MKSFVVFALVVAAVVASPLLHKEDVELETPVEAVEDDLPEDWQLVPDGDGHMHMIDVNHQEPEPAFTASTAVRFLLVTNQNRNNPTRILLNNAAQLQASHFHPGMPTRFIIHGWNNDADSGINNLLRTTYLNRGNFNVFIVDWGEGAQTINYLAARNRINAVGLVVAQFIDFLNIHGAPFSSITIVGHSLGAHTAGIAGKRVTRGRIQNIIALDPAFPLFSENNVDGRVHHTDAVYVESHHTDIGRLGFDTPLGHASFYPNWGRGMPGCGMDLTGSCGHSRAWEFFAQTIPISNAFWATRCAGGFANIQGSVCPPNGPNQLMGGEPVTRAPNGVYFLETNPNSPFARGQR